MRSAIYILIVTAYLAAPAGADGPMYVDNVVILLDGSGSMEQRMGDGALTKMAAAKSALHTVLSQLPEATNVGLLVFSSSVRRPWICPLGPQSPDQIRQGINTVSAGGRTPLGEYIKKAADRLLKQRAAQYGYGSYRLLIVTDGEATDAKLMERYTPEVIARGITIDVIGVDMNRQHTLATKVHSYRRADDPASLQTAIEEVFAEVTAADTTDAAEGDAFDVIAPLPTELATALIQTLATSGNQPIGEEQRDAKPRTRETPPPVGQAAPTITSNSVESGGNFFAYFLMIAVAVIVAGGLVWARTRKAH